MAISTSWQLAQKYREEINAKFSKTSSQVGDQTKQERRILLNHLSKLSSQIHDRGGITIRIEGRV